MLGQQHGASLAVYRGRYAQRGSGLGNVLGSLLKKLGKTALKQGALMIPEIVNDVTTGKRGFLTSLKHHGKNALLGAFSPSQPPKRSGLLLTKSHKVSRKRKNAAAPMMTKTRKL